MKDIDLSILIGLHRNVNSLDRKTAGLAAAEDLTLGQFAVLEALYSKGNQTVGTLRDRILSSAGTIPVIVKNLERRGLILRLADESDRRVCVVSLTEEGRRVIEQVAPENVDMIKHAFSVLTMEEKQELLKLLKKIGRIP